MVLEAISPAPPLQTEPVKESSTEEPKRHRCLGDCGQLFETLDLNSHCLHCGIERTRKIARAEKESAQNKQRWSELSDVLGEGAIKNFTLERFQAYDDVTTRALEVARAFHPSTTNLYLFGVPGCGKTHLAVGIALEAFQAKSIVYFFPSGPSLSRHFRGIEAQEETARIKALATADVLVINELGIGRDTEFSIQMAVEVIDARIMRGRNGLIVTSNLHPKDLAGKQEDGRLESRFTGLCKIIEVGQEDYRKVHRQA